MAQRTLSAVSTNTRALFPSGRGAEPKPLRIRPVDGGLNTWVTPEQIKPNESPRMRDVLFVKNELRKPPGSAQLGADFSNETLWVGTWKRDDGITRTIALTNRNLYFRNTATGLWTQVSPTDVLAGTKTTKYSVVIFDNIMYFVSKNVSLRKWTGSDSESHEAVTGGFAALAMDVINNRLVLVNTLDQQASPSPQTVTWSQNGIARFTGTGSGSSDRFERGDHIQNVKKLGPYRGIVYKDESMVDMRATGDANNPFEFTELAGLGLLSPYGVTEWSGGHFFIGNDEQVYISDGAGPIVIGKPVVKELFSALNYNSLEAVIAFFNRSTSELMLAIPTGSAANTLASVYYAYDIFRKRWRSGVYSNVSWFCNYTARAGVSWDEDLPSWDAATDTWDDENVTQEKYSVLVATGTKRILQLTESSYKFDGTLLQLSHELPDIIGEEDDEDLTLTRVVVGYIVDGSATLTVSASTDLGNSFPYSTNVRLGGSGATSGSIAYAQASLIATGSSVRVKLSNAVDGERVRIVSITVYLSRSGSERAETSG